MFPRALAEGAFSLRAGEATPALAISAELAPDGALAAAAAAPATVRVAARLSYAEVDAADAAGRLAAAPGGLHLLMQARPSCMLCGAAANRPPRTRPTLSTTRALARAQPCRRRAARPACDTADGRVPAVWLGGRQKRACSRQSRPGGRACAARERVAGLAPAGLRGGRRCPVGPRRADATWTRCGLLRCAAWIAFHPQTPCAARQAAEARRRWREARGASVFDSGDAVVRVDGAAGPAPVVTISGGAGGAGGAGRSRAQQLVTEMMILANEAAATLGARC